MFSKNRKGQDDDVRISVVEKSMIADNTVNNNWMVATIVNIKRSKCYATSIDYNNFKAPHAEASRSSLDANPNANTM